MKMLDLFCGRWGWSRKFAERGHECVGIDLTPPPDIPPNCTFIQQDILNITPRWIELQGFDFICASSPCEQFSLHGLTHFHKHPPPPYLGMRLFGHTESICKSSRVPYLMENVRAAQRFVGDAVHHCGPFYLWGNGVPPLMPRGITKGISTGNSKLMATMTRDEKRAYRKLFPWVSTSSGSKERMEQTAMAATIPPELANTVCDYAERLLESSVLSS